MLEWFVKAEQNYIGNIIAKKKISFWRNGLFNILCFLKSKKAVTSNTRLVLVPIIDDQNKKCQHSIGMGKEEIISKVTEKHV